MNVLFIGPVCPLNKIEEIRNISRFFDYPANVLENALIEGFESFADVFVLSSLKLKTCRFYVPKIYFNHDGRINGLVISNINLPFFDKLFNGKRKYKVFKKLKIKPDIVFVYSIRSEDLESAYYIKKRYPDVIVINMLTDLPQYMNPNASRIYKFLKRIEIRFIEKYTKKVVDGFVLLSNYMKEKYPVGFKPYTVVEGIFDPGKRDLSRVEKLDEKVILYTGNMDSRYGIKDLIDAFLLIKKPDYRLWLCGSGDMVEYINKVSVKDNRIKYLGILPRDEVLMLQKQATLLVNPRHSREIYTKYSFPSKTMEYMASGTPTLMSPLLSLPNDYKQHLFLFNDESVEGMAKMLTEVCEKDKTELYNFGLSAKEFIIKNKLASMQCKKILDFAATL